MKIKLLEDFIIKHAHEIIYCVQEFPSYIIDGVGIIKYYHHFARTECSKIGLSATFATEENLYANKLFYAASKIANPIKIFDAFDFGITTFDYGKYDLDEAEKILFPPEPPKQNDSIEITRIDPPAPIVFAIMQTCFTKFDSGEEIFHGCTIWKNQIYRTRIEAIKEYRAMKAMDEEIHERRVSFTKVTELQKDDCYTEEVFLYQKDHCGKKIHTYQLIALSFDLKMNSDMRLEADNLYQDYLINDWTYKKPSISEEDKREENVCER